MSLFDRYIMVDWSAASKPATGADSIWWADVARGKPPDLRNFATRAVLKSALSDLLDASSGERVLVGFDFPFGYPTGFAQMLTGRSDVFAVWDRMAREIKDGSDNRNNRFEVADQINAMSDGVGPFWGYPAGREFEHLPAKGRARTTDLPERRAVENRISGASTCWQLFSGPGVVGGQVLTGLPVLASLRARFGNEVAVWPFEPVDDARIVFAEIYPSLLNAAVKRSMDAAPGLYGGVKDAHQVAVMAGAIAILDRQAGLQAAFDAGAQATEEGWILGVGCEDALRGAAMAPSARLPNDCFALPPGVDWIPVDEALAQLDQNLSPVAGLARTPLASASGRVLASDMTALRDNPPTANSAVDGYGFRHAAAAAQMPLTPGRAAAGQAFTDAVPKGHAIRILTGAPIPDGIDTVVLQEDCTAQGDARDDPPYSQTRREHAGGGGGCAKGRGAVRCGAQARPARSGASRCNRPWRCPGIRATSRGRVVHRRRVDRPRSIRRARSDIRCQPPDALRYAEGLGI